jgi:mannose-6-phosphate isomerase-like protein (cupin superfamily)
MQYALNADDRPDGTLFEVEGFTQRLVDLEGERHEPACDEILYVLAGTGTVRFGEHEHEIRPGSAIFAARDTRWEVLGAARAVSVLVHDPEPSTGHAVLDLDSAERGAATAGRSFLLGATPETGCKSATQFIGLVPAGRAPDHFHNYDEVIYVLDGEGVLEIGGERAGLRRGTCVHLPRTLVHCLANPGPGELRLLGVFRPAGSPAEAYYPDGTLAAAPGGED